MDENQLNVFYAILRITNKVFNGYLDNVVKKIFCDRLKEIFRCTNINAYDIFFDQMTQDMDHFVCAIVELYYPSFDINTVKTKFINYLRSNFEKNFYKNIFKKLNYQRKKLFNENNDKIFSLIIFEFVKYTNEILNETYSSMELFCFKIFDKKCSSLTVKEITESIQKHIDLNILFQEKCLEIDIYCEQKMNHEDRSIKEDHIKKSTNSVIKLKNAQNNLVI